MPRHPLSVTSSAPPDCSMHKSASWNKVWRPVISGSRTAPGPFLQDISQPMSHSHTGGRGTSPICSSTFTGMEGSGCSGRIRADVCLGWAKPLMVRGVFAAVSRPPTPPLSWCQHCSFQLDAVPHTAFLRQWETGPRPSFRRWILVGLSMCSQLNILGLSDWQVSLGSWTLLRRKLLLLLFFHRSQLGGARFPHWARMPFVLQAAILWPTAEADSGRRHSGETERNKLLRYSPRAAHHALPKPILSLDFSVAGAT